MSTDAFKQKKNMLVYYHGADAKSINAIMNCGIDISRGSGELGQGFYVGSSLWRAFSWAWMKAQNSKQTDYGVIQYEIQEQDFLNCHLLCKNRAATTATYENLRKSQRTKSWKSGHDAIWAPIVGKNVQHAYQIKFESQYGELFINQQKKKIIWKK